MKSIITKRLILNNIVRFMQDHSFTEFEDYGDFYVALGNADMTQAENYALHILNNFNQGSANSYGYAIEFLQEALLQQFNHKIARIEFSSIQFADAAEVANKLLGAKSVALMIL